jgi:5-methylcytosine-specific restriction endonuclease McrA
MGSKDRNVGLYRHKAFITWGRECDKCKSTKNLTVHHLNGDITKNNVFNLQVLCKECHKKKHDILNKIKKEEFALQ